MKARKLKEYLGTERTVHQDGGRICIASALCHDLINVDIETLKIKYQLDTFNEGKKSVRDKELLEIWEKLQGLIDRGELLSYLDGDDDIENPIPVYKTEGGELVEKFTEKCGWPNVTHDGELMYDNEYFTSKEDAIEKGIRESLSYEEFLLRRIAEKEQEIETLRADAKCCHDNAEKYKAMIGDSNE